MSEDTVLILTAKNTSQGKNIIMSRVSALMPDYSIKEMMCIHETYEYTEFVILLTNNK